MLLYLNKEILKLKILKICLFKFNRKVNFNSKEINLTMFYKEKTIDDLLNCKKCKNKLDEPRMLPCC